MDSAPSPPPPPPPPPPHHSPSSSPSTPLPMTCLGETETEKRRPNVKAEASSPATPLSFSPSESDEKSKHSRKKISGKRTREEWLEIIDGLVRRRELLRGEIETVNGYYNKLKASNLELKAKKQELGLNRGKTQLEIIKSVNLGMELSKSTQVENKNHPQILHYDLHKQPCVSNQRVFGSQENSQNFQDPYNQISPLLSGLGAVNPTSPLGIPDLNVAAVEIFAMEFPQPLDKSRAVLTDNKAKAAEARRRRMVKMKEMKNSFAAIKPMRCR
ncbi:hypothetical protein U1Q18_016062 [Sarracenia purpurea var. burkii]